MIFDAAKEHLVIIHPSVCHGEFFRLLGLFIDVDLRMRTAIDQTLGKIRLKSNVILRTRGFCGTPELINQYKTHVWGLVEAHCGGYFSHCHVVVRKGCSSSAEFPASDRRYRKTSSFGI